MVPDPAPRLPIEPLPFRTDFPVEEAGDLFRALATPQLNTDTATQERRWQVADHGEHFRAKNRELADLLIVAHTPPYRGAPPVAGVQQVTHVSRTIPWPADDFSFVQQKRRMLR